MKLKIFKVKELEGIKPQIVFKSSFEIINKAFNYQYTKTWVDGLGELYHFIAYATDNEIFVIGTYVNVDNLSNEVIKWNISSKDMNTAELALNNFKISDDHVIWRNKT